MKVDLNQAEWDTVKLSLMTRRDYFEELRAARKASGAKADPGFTANAVSIEIACSDLLKKLNSIPEISP